MTPRPTPALNATLLAAAVAVAATLPIVTPCAAGALTDGSVGPVQSFNGRFTLPQSLGTVKGGNLFHSFTRFSLDSAEVANFTTSDAGIRNVISRVTGGEASTLQGTLQVQAASGSKPEFYFVNPSGITVAGGAVIDVPAGLHLSTAAQLKFADGFVWDTRSAAPSSLTVAAPESFGFLGAAAALNLRQTIVGVQSGHAIELVGGDVNVEQALVAAPDGRIVVTAAGELRIAGGGGLAATSGSSAGSGFIRVDAGAVTLDGSNGGALIRVQTPADAVVPAAGVELRVSGAVNLFEGADISATNRTAMPGPGIRIAAAALTLDGRASVPVGIATYTYADGSGGTIALDVAGEIGVAQGGQIFSSTYGNGRGGDLRLAAGSMTVNARQWYAFVGTQAKSGGQGRAGDIDIRLGGALVVSAGGTIDTSTETSGAPGRIDLQAGSAYLDGQGSTTTTGIQSHGGGMKIDIAGALDLKEAAIWSLARDGVKAADVDVRAGTISIDGVSAGIKSTSFNSGDSAALHVAASDRITISGRGSIESLTDSAGAAGDIDVRAPRIEIVGVDEFKLTTGINSSTLDAAAGRAGSVRVDASELSLARGGSVASVSASETFAAGGLQIRADRIVIDGNGHLSGLTALTTSSTSDAGPITIVVQDELLLRRGGAVLSLAIGGGHPGEITIQAGKVTLDGQGQIDSPTSIGGDAVHYQDYPGAAAGGRVTIDAGQLVLRNGGSITSWSSTSADAGTLRLTADQIEVDGGVDPNNRSFISTDTLGSGRAGNIVLRANELQVLNQGYVTSSSQAEGPGGSIDVEATRVRLSQGGVIASYAAGRGNAGNVAVRATDALELVDGGFLVTNTGGPGAAGRVTASSGSLLVAGRDATDGSTSRIASRAMAASGGQPGSLAIEVSGTAELRDGGLLTIANDAPVAPGSTTIPTSIALHAGQIVMNDGEVTAASSIDAPAGRVALTADGTLRMSGSAVRTTSVDGNGGAISIAAGALVWLHDSQVTTSVKGRTNGNGGDIAVSGRALLLESGFVQANTAAAQAHGGDVSVDVSALVPNGSNLFIGGNRIEVFRAGVPGFNVIQAAAPDGLSGTLDLTLPQLNIAGSLVGLVTPQIDFGPIGRDFCQLGDESSLTLLGRGALPAKAATPLRIVP